MFIIIVIRIKTVIKTVIKNMIVYSNVYRQNLKTEIDYIFKESILKDVLWEQKICTAICSHYVPNTDILDIGANIGLVSLGTCVIARNSQIEINKIHCFECNHYNFHKLAYNTMDNDKIQLYNFGLADKMKIATMGFNKYNNGCSFVNKTMDKNETNTYVHDSANITVNDKYENVFVSLISLDSIIDNFTNPVSVIKVDIEGFEYFFLLGAHNFINKFHPVIIIEIMPEHSNKINSILSIYGYQYIEQIGEIDFIYKYFP